MSDKDEAINQILLLIASEENGIAQILNDEGTKIERVISMENTSIEDLLAINYSVKTTLQSVANNQIYLDSKLKTALGSTNND